MREDKTENITFQDILIFKKQNNIVGFSIMEVVLMYCEEMDEDIDEVGSMLKKDKSFRETFMEDLKFHKEAKFEGDVKYNSMSEWI